MDRDRSGRIDKRQARAAFSRAASHYDEVAELQREIGRRMLQRLSYIRHQPKVVLDVGAGTGEATLALKKHYGKARTIALDFALPMLHQVRKRGGWLNRPSCVCGDAEQLPLADQSVDMIFSNAALQWCNDLQATFSEFLRVLRPNGMLLFSTFGPDTLQELRASWSRVDGHSHVSPFPDMHDVGDAMVRAGLAEPVVDVDRLRLDYDEVSSLMRDLKTLGAHNVTCNRPRGLTGKGRLRAMCEAYEAFRTDDNKLPASYEVVYGHAWAPKQRQVDGVTCIPVDQIGRERA
ncbi:MAG: malonyl-ACP O-methyltransferase BioC [Candidatus Thiodiazotropha sp.]|nr:malonyl-ACP O-methyltransferase BioC [Candidatus Thiodiazotropha taylori]MBT3058864.1 malonyl-ACP O-methyltransferase BioC [Candidatus Thiodiazotropha sp. (ex Lucina pensylvanica)]MBV2096981.1 malonyl-ACP O-methyltransferase BioC [Candidatus Thiodiazotropha sp. (ex Codakia orbicularis)]PUB75758.1 MAG: malonyl-[acyl-carrier protein] O-methyltransferase BioC [gamma proteobacterium symbiont of Ctena orbiculata]MBT3063080.1 malonyl-ACP O-methyltransferase BioC [Candidatus Thiodiazotropha sp. (ex